MRDLVIGVDVGSSSAKAVLVDRDGRLLAWSRQEYPMHRPHPGWAENDPEDWVRAVIAGIHDLLDQARPDSADVRALCVVAQRDPLVLLDREGHALAPSIHWLDRRALAETSELYDRLGRNRLTQTTGLVPVPGLGLASLHWLMRHRPDVWRRTRKILAVKDYVLYRLTGRIATDQTTPACSLLYNIRKHNWSEWICREAGVDHDLLPAVEHRASDVWCELDEPSAERLGLQAGTMVAAGGGDDPAAALGSGAIKVGDISVGTGTISHWRIVSKEPTIDPKGRADTLPHVISGLFIRDLVIAGTGTSLRWYRRTFGASPGAKTCSYEELLEKAEGIAPGSGGLLFYPFLEGSMAPYFNDAASGVFFGLRSDHGQGDFVRAILEGIAFQYPPVMALLEEFGAKFDGTLRLADDETRSPLWNQIKADVTGVEVETLRVWMGGSMGAAILAAMACAIHSTFEAAVDAMVAPARRYRPDPQRSAHYGELRRRYETVLSHLEAAFRATSQGDGPVGRRSGPSD